MSDPDQYKTRCQYEDRDFLKSVEDIEYLFNLPYRLLLEAFNGKLSWERLEIFMPSLLKRAKELSIKKNQEAKAWAEFELEKHKIL